MGYEQLALFSFRYPKIILIIWTMLLVFFGFFAPKLESELGDHGLFPEGPYKQVSRILSTDFHIPEDPVIVLFEKKSNVTQVQFQSYIQQAMNRIKGIKEVTTAISPLHRTGMQAGNYAYAIVGLSYESHQMKSAIESLDRLLPADNSMITIKMTGKSIVQADVNQASHRDLSKAELIGLPLAFLILWLTLGRIVTALVPIVIGMTSVTIAMGIMYMLATKMDVSNFVRNVIPMVGLALSIDFALMVVSRFREELANVAPEQAIRTTIRTAGRAVLISACSVCFGLAGILLIPLSIFTTVALGAMTVLIVSVLLSLTLLPALLALLLPYISESSKRKPARRKHNMWHVLPSFVMRRPTVMFLLAMILLIICWLPLNKLQLAIPDAESLPQSYEARQAAESLQTYFETPNSSQIYLIAKGKGQRLSQQNWNDAVALVKELEAEPMVLQADSVFSRLGQSPEQLYVIMNKPALMKKYAAFIQPFVKDNQLLIRVTLKGDRASRAVIDWLRVWEQKAETAELPYLLGGEAKVQQEVYDTIFEHVKGVLLFIFISNFIILFAAFRSVLIAFKTMVMNLLSLGASFGILVWLFQAGYFGIEPTSIAIMIPIFIFGLVFGISMDYGVFLVSRIYEIYRQTNDNKY